jgi:hypothetical protein
MPVTATLTIAYHGDIHDPLAIAMRIGSAISAGIHYSGRLGDVWLKRRFVGIALVMVIKLLAGAITVPDDNHTVPPLEQRERRRSFRFRIHRS